MSMRLESKLLNRQKGDTPGLKTGGTFFCIDTALRVERTWLSKTFSKFLTPHVVISSDFWICFFTRPRNVLF